MQKGQILLGIGTLIFALLLYFAGRTVPKKVKASTAVAQGFSFEEYEARQLAKLTPEEKEKFGSITAAISSAAASDTSAQRQAFARGSEFWRDLQDPTLAAWYIYRLAQADGTKTALENAGDVLVEAFKTGSDSTISNNLITFALRSYEQAADKDPGDIGLKIKLADVYVQGSAEPMKGIGILRQLADSLPDNIPVAIALGRLSIQSGQYDKAKERLNRVLKLEPQNTEALYFMAITEAQLGHTDEAVRLFEMCKLLVGNEEFNKEIDEIVKSLKSKKV